MNENMWSFEPLKSHHYIDQSKERKSENHKIFYSFLSLSVCIFNRIGECEEDSPMAIDLTANWKVEIIYFHSSLIQEKVDTKSRWKNKI